MPAAARHKRQRMLNAMACINRVAAVMHAQRQAQARYKPLFGQPGTDDLRRAHVV